MRTRPTLTVAAVTALVAAPMVTTMQPAPAAPAAATVAQLGSYPCHGFGGFEKTNSVAGVKQDYFTAKNYRRVKVGRNHDIDWKIDPFKQDSWHTYLHQLKWTGSLVITSSRGPYAARDWNAIDEATAIAADWVKDNPYPWPTGPGAGSATHTRTEFLLCLREGLEKARKPVPAWLDTSLLQHADWLRKHPWVADHNIATEQQLAILGVGCLFGRDDLEKSAEKSLAGTIGRVVDAQGANNEQSVGYANWNYELWGRVEADLATCGIESPARDLISARRAGLLGFLAYATRADGTLQPLGDTTTTRPPAASPELQWVTSNGTSGTAPKDRVKVYNAGYVFGRSGWGTGARPLAKESIYTLRFGPRRIGHGHSDHTAITWESQGRPILVDSGTGSYNMDAWRRHYIGPEAHNQLVVAGMINGSDTRLVRSSTKPGADFYEFADTPYLKTNRTRSLIVLSDPDIVVAFDRASSYKPTSFTQFWHLPHDVSPKASGSTLTATKGGVTTTLVNLPAAGVTTTSAGVVKGATKPIQGWEWTDYTRRHAAPVATLTQKGRSAAMVTAVVASPARDKVAVTSAVSGRTTTYTFTVGGTKAVVTLDAKGTLTRTR